MSICGRYNFVLVFIAIFSVIITTEGIKMPDMKRHYDYIIVGGGTAGLVLASRLTEDPKVHVLVLEVGPSDTSDPFVEIPRTTVATFKDPNINWKYYLEPQKHLNNTEFSFITGKMLGGGSSHNGMTIARAAPYDFDKWEQLGNKGWGFSNVLKYYKKMENVNNPELVQNDFRGTEGPFPITYSHKFPMADLFIKGGEEIGLNATDYFSPKQGFGYNQQNIDAKGKRMSTAAAYLRPVIGRWNLKVVTGAFVTKILIRGGKKATGVLFEKNEGKFTALAAKEVIVSAGSIQSPLLLMTSGIGPKDQLKSLKIPVKADLPVGQALQDRLLLRIPFKNVGTYTRDSTLTFQELFKFLFTGSGGWTSIGQLALGLFRAKNQPENNNSTHLLLSFRQDLAKLPKPLVDGILANNEIDSSILENFKQSEDNAVGFTVWVFHLSPRMTGKVELKTSDPHDAPKITMNYLEDQRDAEDIIGGIRIAQELMSANALKEEGLDIIHEPITECSSHPANSDEYWQCFLEHRALPGSQFMSSCRMGRDEFSVLDDRLRVKGIKGLRVVDASMIPTSLSGNPMVQVIMIAEKAADLIKQDA